MIAIVKLQKYWAKTEDGRNRFEGTSRSMHYQLELSKNWGFFVKSFEFDKIID